MLLSKILDDRLPIHKARLSELQRYAKEEGVQCHPEMGAEEIRQRLIAAGKTNISPPPRFLGQYQQNPTPTSHRWNQQPPSQVPQAKPVQTVSWAEDLARQRAQAVMDTPISEMTITEARKACKAKGIKIKRTDKMSELKAKLNGLQNAP